jgi:hypothetical protein
VSDFIEGFYNPTRHHSAHGRLSPIDDEAGAFAENDQSLPASRQGRGATSLDVGTATAIQPEQR